MALKPPKEIWSEQYEAARDIKARYGSKAAFDYIVAEKLMGFAEAAYGSSDFAREMPSFVAAVRNLFQKDEMSTHLARIEQELVEEHTTPVDEGDVLADDHKTAVERMRRFVTVKELLEANMLGTA